jgi:hypothetical protein
MTYQLVYVKEHYFGSSLVGILELLWLGRITHHSIIGAALSIKKEYKHVFGLLSNCWHE